MLRREREYVWTSLSGQKRVFAYKAVPIKLENLRDSC